MAIILGLMALFAIQAYSAINYSDRNYPYYSGNYAVASPDRAQVVTVVSYNIWFAEEIDKAVSELREIQSQREIGVLLLQEMDEAGAEQIARELRLNYVYYPAAIEPTYDKNFGNAILSRWPIIDSQKLILPHKSLSNRMNRTATRATIRIQDAEILVYGLHTESIFTLPQFREDQYTAVLEDIPPEAMLVIVGGDFNSFTRSDVKNIEEQFRQAGFTRASEGSEATIAKYGIELSADHIFTKGFVVEEAGALTAATASDHLPIWVSLRPR